jgi:hypothetical protein
MNYRALTVSAALAAGVVGFAPICRADIVASDQGIAVRDGGAAAPARGMTMAQVASKFGDPVTKVAAVGNPPISRWEYSSFVVYFERDHVIHAVVSASAPSDPSGAASPPAAEAPPVPTSAPTPAPETAPAPVAALVEAPTARVSANPVPAAQVSTAASMTAPVEAPPAPVPAAVPSDRVAGAAIAGAAVPGAAAAAAPSVADDSEASPQP